jgi:hypothetical protein
MIATKAPLTAMTADAQDDPREAKCDERTALDRRRFGHKDAEHH